MTRRDGRRVGPLLLLAWLVSAGTGTAQDAAWRVQELLRAWRAGALESEEFLTRQLVEVGKDGVAPLCTLVLTDPAPLPGAAVAAALGQLGDPRGIPALAAIRGRPESRDAVAAVHAFETLDVRAVVEPLMEALEDDRDEVVEAAADTFAALHAAHGEWRVVKSLLAGLERTKQKRPFAHLLGRLGGDDAREGLIVQLRFADEDTAVILLEGLWDLIRDAEDARYVSVLLHRSTDDAVQRKCCLLLGRLRYRPATRRMLALLESPTPGVVADAHWALTQLTGLRLRARPDLWRQWWERGGEVASGPQDD